MNDTMPRTQIIYDIFDPYLKCNNKGQREQYANFVLAMYNNYGRYIRIPEFINDKNELIDAYVKSSINRLPIDIQEFIALVGTSSRFRGFTRKLNDIKSLPDRNCIQFIDFIVKEFVDDIHRVVLEKYKKSLEFILSLDFEDVKSQIAQFLTPDTDDDEEEDDDDDELSVATSRDEDKEHYGKTLETVQKMLDNHIPRANEKEEIKETRKKTKEEKEKEQLEKIRKRNELIAEQNRLLEERQRLKKEKKIEGKTECGCGGYFILSNKVHHFKTKKHLTWEASQKEEVV
jgi:hypothetical protein